MKSYHSFFVFLVCIMLLPSCSSTISMLKADSNIRKVEIGMTQEEVIAIMGKHYEVIALDGDGIVLGYKSVLNDYSIYHLYFVENKLIEWRKEFLPYTAVYSPPTQQVVVSV